MADYIGKKCIVCDKEFEKDDDIVVCPDCGTPYHRECYLEQGQCINQSLHENGGSWTQEQEAKEHANGENVKCARCGGENPSDAIFCNYCGLPLGMKQGGAAQSFNDTYPHTQQQNPYGQQQNPYGQQGTPFGQFGMTTQQFTQDSDIDGNTLGEYALYIRSNKAYFMTQFIRFAKFAKKMSFSFVAFLFPEFYFFYRKMFKEGIFAFLLMLFMSMPSLIIMFQPDSDYLKLMAAGSADVLVNNVNVRADWFVIFYDVCSIGSWVFQIVCGLLANFWYYKKAKNDIDRIKSVGGSSEAISAKGGTSTGCLILAFVIYMAMSILMLVAVRYRADILGFLGINR